MQNKLFLRSILLVSFFIVNACLGDKSSDKPKVYEKGYSSRSDRDILIPKQVIQEVEKVFLAGFRRENPKSDLTDAQVTAQLPRQYFTFEVSLEPKNMGSALDHNYQFLFPKGGGVIDLKDYIKPGKGSFRVRIEIKEDKFIETGFSDLKVYFLPQSKQRRLEGRNFGGGCGKVVDITSYFKNMIMTEGVEVNATKLRYLSVLHGTFFMTIYHQGNLFMTSLSFEDSRYPQHSCDFRA